MHIVSVRMNKRSVLLFSALFLIVIVLLIAAVFSRHPVSAPQADSGFSAVSSENGGREEHYPGEPVRVLGQPDEYWQDQLSALE